MRGEQEEECYILTPSYLCFSPSTLSMITPEDWDEPDFVWGGGEVSEWEERRPETSKMSVGKPHTKPFLRQRIVSEWFFVK
jgi:hypothetical protein